MTRDTSSVPRRRVCVHVALPRGPRAKTFFYFLFFFYYFKTFKNLNKFK